jgi:hypothetical protein
MHLLIEIESGKNRESQGWRREDSRICKKEVSKDKEAKRYIRDGEMEMNKPEAEELVRTGKKVNGWKWKNN